MTLPLPVFSFHSPESRKTATKAALKVASPAAFITDEGSWLRLLSSSQRTIGNLQMTSIYIWWPGQKEAQGVRIKNVVVWLQAYSGQKGGAHEVHWLAVDAVKCVDFGLSLETTSCSLVPVKFDFIFNFNHHLTPSRHRIHQNDCAQFNRCLERSLRNICWFVSSSRPIICTFSPEAQQRNFIEWINLVFLFLHFFCDMRLRCLPLFIRTELSCYPVTACQNKWAWANTSDLCELDCF